MTTKFNSFDQSPLGAFIQSPLGVRNDGAKGDLVILGAFFQADGNVCRKTAKLDEDTPEIIAIDSRGLNNNVFSGIIHLGDLNIGGSFSQSGTGAITIRKHAKFNVSTGFWEEATGGGVTGGSAINHFCTFGSDIVLVGSFTAAGGVADTRFIAQYNGSSYSGFTPPTFGFSASVLTCAEFQGELHIGGLFLNPFNGGAKWNGSAWVDIDPRGFDERFFRRDVSDMLIFQSQLVIAGDFTTPDPAPDRGRNIVLWDGTDYDVMDDGVNNSVSALAIFQGDLIVGGIFTQVGSSALSANRVARWNGSSWSAMGSGLNSAVNGLHVHNGTLYATGSFTQNGSGDTMTRIAQFDTSTGQFKAVSPGAGLDAQGLGLVSFSGFDA